MSQPLVESVAASSPRARRRASRHEWRLERLELSVHIGCEPEERAAAQRMEVSITVRSGELPAACASDRLADTLPLEVVAERLRSIAESGSFALLEHLAQRLHDGLAQLCPPGAIIDLRVTKLAPPIAGLRGGMTFRLRQRAPGAAERLLGDAAVRAALRGERSRQAETIELIPSENYTYPEVLAALGSVLTDKYAEGYPGRRYYGGSQFCDQLEELARARACQLFRAEHANVQPLSGSPMNQAAYLALLEPGDTILAMDLSHGGHLTHGAPVSHMGRLFHFVRYRTRAGDGRIDYDELAQQARQHRPKLVLCGYTSYPRDYDYAAFRRIADEAGALLMADVSHVGGLIAAGSLPNPFDHGADVVTTTTHKTLRGPRSGIILCRRQHARAIDRSVFPGLQGGPHMNTIAAVAVALGKALEPAFAEYGRAVLDNARCLAGELLARGARLITGGTENHLLVLDTSASFGIDGAEAEALLERAGMTCNKQVIPDDPRPALRPSGIRIGTPAITTRCMGRSEMIVLAQSIVEALQHRAEPERLEQLRARCAQLCRAFPIPGRSQLHDGL